jgi:hypothetical protein
VNLGTGSAPSAIIDIDATNPLHVNGRGTLLAGAETELFRTVAVIESLSNVIAADLVVQTWFDLKGDASLSHSASGHIELLPEINLKP